MQHRTRQRGFRATSLTCLAIAGALLASCASQPAPTGKVGKSKEYFSEKEYGVEASPRVTSKRSRLPRGGGRDQLGKAYKIKGKWYKPREDPGYVKVGAASWYGDAFHGRLTANGEIYDMTHLTAAHPTMPLPSYARVTNIKNGSSVIVRVNDRGPFAHDRVIDLSKRAAEMLDYAHAGVAKVKVEFVGRAPLHGQDDQYLMASYRPGAGEDGPSDGLATGVMIAMNGPTPSAGAGTVVAAAFPGQLNGATVIAAGDPDLPDHGPAIPERPAVGFGDVPVVLAALSYADERIERASSPFSVFAAGLGPAEIISSWNRRHGGPEREAASAYIAAGTFAGEAQARALHRALSDFGHAELVAEPGETATWYTVNLYPDGRRGIDHMLEMTWAAGAGDAIVVRD